MSDESDIAVNGTSLHFALDGKAGAPLVVLANALATDHRMWDPQIPALAERYHVLRFDYRGHGRSAAPAGPYAMDMLVDDLLGLVAAVGAQQFCVVGLSLGGLIAVATALRAPAGLAGIVMCDSRADMPPEFQKGIDDRNAAVRANGLDSIADGLLERWFTPPTLAARPAYIDTVRGMITGTDIEGFTGCSEAIKGASLRPRIKDIRLPTLFVAGDQDAALPVDLMREMAAEVAGARGVVIPDAGHLSNMERPEAFNAAVIDFLETVWSGRI